jgi:hypothetical protein
VQALGLEGVNSANRWASWRKAKRYKKRLCEGMVRGPKPAVLLQVRVAFAEVPISNKTAMGEL